MAQKKAHEVGGWLGRPDPAFKVILIYGPDKGLVSERARAFAAQTGVPLDDPFSVIRIDAAAIEQQPGRLLDEAGTVPMFSDKRLIWIGGAGAQKSLAAEARMLAAEPPPDAVVLIEAGELKKGAPLRSAIESERFGMALPCYGDDGRGLDAVIEEVLSASGMTIGLEARQVLKSALGGDRLATRSELDKLVLYCLGAERIELPQILAVIGDTSAQSFDSIVDSMLLGSEAQFDAAFSRFVSGGGAIAPLLSAALRQFQALQILKADMDMGGKTASAAVAGARPPVFFARRKLVEAVLVNWTAPAISRALGRLQAATLQNRRQPDFGISAVRQAMLAIAIESARRKSPSSYR